MDPQTPALLMKWARDARYGVGALDENGRFEYLNDAWARLLGYSREDLLGRSVAELLDAENLRIYEEQFEARRHGSDQPYEITYRTGGRGEFHCLLAPSPRFDDEGNFRGSCGLALPPDSNLVSTVRALARPVGATAVTGPRTLTSREREVFNLLVRGTTARAIAGQLHISVNTVRNHLRSIYAKCDVHSQMELIAKLQPQVPGGRSSPGEPRDSARPGD